MKHENSSELSRRSFLKKAGIAAAGITIVPSYVVSGMGHKAPSDKLNIAAVGVGGKGRTDINGCSEENIVALCDADWERGKESFEKYPKAKRYKDFRKMLDEMGKDIDAVIVSTPDHFHAVAAASAMTLGKHVYVQKPLTHSVYESRLLTKLAKKYKVATQMGNQGSSSDDIRTVCEWIWNGEIGDVKEVHCWTNRPVWPQGLSRPEGSKPIPSTMDWDVWIGPARMVPFNDGYAPFKWRGWWDFGLGALGDMACHIMDNAFRSLELKYPTEVYASSTPFNTAQAPSGEMCTFTFPARKTSNKNIKINLGEVTVTWYDGGLLPKRPAMYPNMSSFIQKDKGSGTMFVGTKDVLLTGCYSKEPELLSGRKPQVKQILPRIPNKDHYKDWIRACKEDPKYRTEASSHFGFAGPFNEMVVMGAISTRLSGLDKPLRWDGENMRFTNISADEKIIVPSAKADVPSYAVFEKGKAVMNAQKAAQDYIKHSYRAGWSLPDMPNI